MNSPTSEILDQAPPHSLDAERGVVASILLDLGRLDDVTSIVKPGDFRDPKLRMIYGYLIEFPHNGSGPVDLTSLLDWLPESARELAPTIVELFEKHPTAAHAKHYAGIVRGLADRRRLLELLKDNLQAAYASDNGTAEMLRDIRAGLDALDARAAGEDRFNWITDSDLAAADFSVEFLINGVLVRHQPGVMIGPSKAMKTNTVVDMAVSLAYGRPFLGRFDVPNPVRVGIASGESGMAAIRNTNRRVREAKELGPDEVDRVFFTEDVPNFSSLEDLEAVRRDIVKYALDVVIVDPLYQAIPEAESSRLEKMGEVLRAANQVCRDTGCTLLLVHHTIKRPGQTAGRSSFAPLCREDVHGAGVSEWMR